MTAETDAYDAIKERAGGGCELRIPRVCLGRYGSYQHRKRRAQCTRDELWDIANGLGVCGDGTHGCHGWITGHPAASEPLGWSLRQAWVITERRAWMFSPNYGQGWYLLGSDGGLNPVWDVPPPRELAA